MLNRWILNTFLVIKEIYLVFRSLQDVVRSLIGMIVNSDKNESKQTKKPTSMICKRNVINAWLSGTKNKYHCKKKGYDRYQWHSILLLALLHSNHILTEGHKKNIKHTYLYNVCTCVRMYTFIYVWWEAIRKTDVHEHLALEHRSNTFLMWRSFKRLYTSFKNLGICITFSDRKHRNKQVHAQINIYDIKVFI